MPFNMFQALKGLEQRSNHLIDLLANSTGRTVDVMYATLVHRCEAWRSSCISPPTGSNPGTVWHQLTGFDRGGDHTGEADPSAGWV